MSRSNFETNPSTKILKTYYVDVTLGNLKKNKFYGFSIFNFVPNFLNVRFVLLLLHDPEMKQRKIANLKKGDWDEQEKRSGSSEDTNLGKKFNSEESNFGD